MTHEEKQKLKALYVATALYYSQEIPDSALKLYVEDLADLPYDRVAAALGDLRRDPNTRRCPMPSDVRAKVLPEEDPESAATLAANEIVEMIARCGPYQLPKLSPIASQIVQMEGGWEQVCERVTNENLGIFKAQWRQLGKAIATQKKSEEPLSLREPQSNASPLLELKSLFKDMPK